MPYDLRVAVMPEGPADLGGSVARRKGHLVYQHVERMPRRILEEHPDVVREYVKGKRGVYADTQGYGAA